MENFRKLSFNYHKIPILIQISLDLANITFGSHKLCTQTKRKNLLLSAEDVTEHVYGYGVISFMLFSIASGLIMVS